MTDKIPPGTAGWRRYRTKHRPKGKMISPETRLWLDSLKGKVPERRYQNCKATIEAKLEAHRRKRGNEMRYLEDLNRKLRQILRGQNAKAK